MKKVVKLLIISLLVLSCAIGLVACGVSPDKANDPGIVCKKLSGDDFYTVIGYNAKEGETSLDISVAAQEKYGDDNTVITVGRIRNGAFDGNNTLTEVIVSDKAGDGVDLTIDEGAFKNMRALEKITLPFVGANADSDAYYNATAPSENKAVDKERSFGYIFGEEEAEYASAMTLNYGSAEDATATFYIPVALREVTVKAENDVVIPMYAFCGVKRINKVTLAGNITAIGESAFKDMTGLTKISIPKAVTVIHDSAFSGTTALVNFTVAADSQLTAIKDNAFKGTALKTFDISGTQLKTIGDYAFYGSSLTAVSLPTTVESVGAYAFANSKDLADVYNKPTAEKCGVNAFAGTKI